MSRPFDSRIGQGEVCGGIQQYSIGGAHDSTRMQDLSSREVNHDRAGDASLMIGLDYGTTEPEFATVEAPAIGEWYKELCRNLSGDGSDHREEASAQNGFYHAGDNSNLSGGLIDRTIEPDHEIAALDSDGDEDAQFDALRQESLEPIYYQEEAYTGDDSVTNYQDPYLPVGNRGPVGSQGGLLIPPAQRRVNPQIDYPQQIDHPQQLAQTPLQPTQCSQSSHQPAGFPHRLRGVGSGSYEREAAPGSQLSFRNSHRVQKSSSTSTPARRNGHSVPPVATDPRWTIWTLGNMDIRYVNGGVTVKHLQQVLYNIDGGRRTKCPYESLKNQIISRRNTLWRSAPAGWNPIQGWWVYLKPEK